MNTKMVPISELAEVNPKTELHGLKSDSLVSFIPMADVTESGNWVGRQVLPLCEARVGYTAFAEDDVLFAKITPCMENGKGALVKGLVNGLGFGSTEFHVLRAKGDNDPRYIFHWLQTKQIRLRAIAYMGGSAGQQRVQKDFFVNYRVPEKAPAEQSRIAYVLDTIDEAITQTEAVIVKLKQVRTGMLHDLLNYGVDEHGQLRDPNAHPEQFKASPLGRIPSNWEVGPFSEIVTVNPPTPSTGLSPFNSISFIPMQDVDEEGNWVYRQTKKLINCSSGYTPFIERDVLFAKITPCMENGKGCHAIDLLNGFGMGSTEFHVLRPKSNTSARFVFHWSLTKSMRIRALAYMTGSAGQQRVEAGFFNHFLIPIPTIDEQGLIADVIDGADRQIEASWNELQKLKTLKSGIQDDLLTGRVRVPETIMEGAENA